MPENSADFPFEEYDYVVDAVDTVTAKIELVMKCQEMNVPIISSMGAGNKLDASRFQVADIYKTKVCPLAKSHAKGIKKTRCEKIKGGLFRGTADKTDRRYGDQLQNELYLPTGSRA